MSTIFGIKTNLAGGKIRQLCPHSNSFTNYASHFKNELHLRRANKNTSIVYKITRLYCVPDQQRAFYFPRPNCGSAVSHWPHRGKRLPPDRLLIYHSVWRFIRHVDGLLIAEHFSEAFINNRGPALSMFTFLLAGAEFHTSRESHRDAVDRKMMEGQKSATAHASKKADRAKSRPINEGAN